MADTKSKHAAQGGSAASSPNYITPAGARRLQSELARLRSVDRPKMVTEVADAAAQGDRSENAEYIYGKKKLREIDRRIRFLTKRLESAVVVEPRSEPTPRIFFGATVDVEDEDGNLATYSIVGQDEIAPSIGRISWTSPLGRNLLSKREGDTFVFRRPNGDIEITITKVRYLPLEDGVTMSVDELMKSAPVEDEEIGPEDEDDDEGAEG